MKKSICLFVLLLFMSGCAFGTRRPMLTYSTAVPTASKNSIVIKVGDFKDERTWSKEKIGDVRNGYGTRCAEIIPQNSVIEWIRDAFKKELLNAGYTISEVSNDAITVEGSVLEVYVDAVVNYAGRIKLNIILQKGEKKVLNKEYYAAKVSGMNWAARAATYEKTIELTLQELMSKVIPDINNALLGNEGKVK